MENLFLTDNNYKKISREKFFNNFSYYHGEINNLFLGTEYSLTRLTFIHGKVSLFGGLEIRRFSIGENGSNTHEKITLLSHTKKNRKILTGIGKK